MLYSKNMSSTHALRFLSLFLLLLIMNGKNIEARDMKIELQDEKVDEDKTTMVSNNSPYLVGYRTISKSVEPNYIDSAKNQNHHQQKLTQPYTTSYSHAHQLNHPYITAYGADKTPKESHNSDDASVPYITSYSGITHSNDDTTKPYITQYGATNEANHPYITAYKKVPKQSPHVDSTVPYITQYDRNIHANEADHPQITVYGAKKVPQHSSYDGTSKTYITQYGDSKTDMKKSSSVDHSEAFKVGFFALTDLHVGNVMTLQFPIGEVSQFLPRKEADSIPFSTSQLPSVLQLFSIPEDSPEAVAMRGTLEQCEGEPITGETKICATSLESMLEFVSTTIGSETKCDILTTTLPTTAGAALQKFTILEVSEDINAPKWVACHPLPYPYAIYYCHSVDTESKAFKVLLGSENGENKVEALGICHLDTSDWDPNHIIFRQLGIKAGQDPVCHFFLVKHLLWIPQPSQATM
ncbi:protein RAFTIN 1B-like isoform X2 [Vigna unguiculata]|uniref:protein RAFTIN 1B-like isoform X2 n=1 Tax=Vigna unguiculata TaxID=3917 RepID=UPI0010168415|nr:protein RAFTIN 1B-like isoform X2 [Vigna unguiculata]